MTSTWIRSLLPLLATAGLPACECLGEETVTGVVVDLDGDVLPDVEVYACERAGCEPSRPECDCVESLTDADGRFELGAPFERAPEDGACELRPVVAHRDGCDDAVAHPASVETDELELILDCS